MGLVKVVLPDEASCSREVTSERVGTLRRAETRGKSDFAEDEVADTTWVKPLFPLSSPSKRGESISGTGSAYWGDVECSTEVTPFNL